MERAVDIHKAAGILLSGRKLLVTRSRDKESFFAPGGKVESGETVRNALIRELKEELGITVTDANISVFGTFYALATENSDKYLQMDVFRVLSWEGEIQASSEIEEITWMDSHLDADFKLGSIFKYEVIPRLKEMDLID